MLSLLCCTSRGSKALLSRRAHSERRNRGQIDFTVLPGVQIAGLATSYGGAQCAGMLIDCWLAADACHRASTQKRREFRTKQLGTGDLTAPNHEDTKPVEFTEPEPAFAMPL